jgi:hypothetical protein
MREFEEFGGGLEIELGGGGGNIEDLGNDVESQNFDATRFTAKGPLPAVATTDSPRVGLAASDLAYGASFSLTPEPTLGAETAETAETAEIAETAQTESSTVTNQLASEQEIAEETTETTRASRPKLKVDLGWLLLTAIGEITSSWGKAARDNALIEKHATAINTSIEKAGFGQQAFVLEMLYQFRGALKGVDGDFGKYLANVDLAHARGYLGANGRRLLREAVTGKREKASTNDAIIRVWVENAMNGVGGVTAEKVASQARSLGFSAAAIESAVQLIEFRRNLSAVGEVGAWVSKLENLTEAARKHDMITAWRNTDLLKWAESLRTKHGLGPRGQSAEDRRAEVDARGPANGSLEYSRQRMRQLIEEIRYLDTTLASRNYGSLHYITGLYRQVALDAIRKLPKLEAMLESTEGWRIDQTHDEVLRAASFKGIGGPRQLADYLTNTNSSTLTIMDNVARMIGMLPGIGIPVTVVVSGSVELIKASQGQQTWEVALTKIVTKAITDKLGKSLKKTGPGAAILTAVMNGASSFAVSAATIATDPKTSWDTVGDQLRVALGRAMLDAFASVISQQAKAVNRETAENDFIDMVIGAANEFGLKAEVKEMLNRELPLSPR